MNKQLFMGNGEYSNAKCFELVSDLMRAFTLLSGIQQPLDPCEDMTDVERNKYYDDIADDVCEVHIIAKKIAESLTGKRIIIEK